MNYFSFPSNYNNNFNELLSIYINNSNSSINNNQNINNSKIIFDKLNNQIINNNYVGQMNNLNKNNINFFTNLNNNFNSSQFQQKIINDKICNNMIINNQFYTPININLQLTNENNKESLKNFNSLNQFNYKNNYNFNYNNLINNNLNKYIQSNYMPQFDIYPSNNEYINNLIKTNEENLNLKLIENQLNNNLIDFFANNNINNVNNVIKFKNAKSNNNNKQINDYNPEKNKNNSIKRKIFNPLPDSEKEKNIINLMNIFQCKDKRTTLMIKNIPNKYTISTFLEEINENFKNTYDIFYLPIDYINKCNLGFAFINFVEPYHIILFYELYRGKKWKKFNSDKICELLYAKFQGRKELISHFEKGKVLSFDSEDKRPLILPVPHPLPKINLPCYYLDLFVKLYPYVFYEIKNTENYNNRSISSLSKVFSIKGNFNKN